MSWNLQTAWHAPRRLGRRGALSNARCWIQLVRSPRRRCSFARQTADIDLNTARHDPWDWPAWRTRTKFIVSPLAGEAAFENPPPGWTADTLNNVRAFAEAYWSHTRPEVFIKALKDNDAAGRDAWNKFVVDSWARKWDLNKAIDDCLAQCFCDSWTILKKFNLKTLPDLDASQIEAGLPNVAFLLFGEHAFLPNYDVIIPAVHTCVKGIIATTYNRWRKTHATFSRGLERKQSKMEELQAALESGKVLTIVQVRAYVKALSVYQADLERLSDEASIASLEDTRARLEDMLVAMGCDKSGKTITRANANSRPLSFDDHPQPAKRLRSKKV